MKIEKLSLSLLAFLQTTSLVIYIAIVSQFLFNSAKFHGPYNSFLGPVAFLLLFVVSALVTGVLVLGRSSLLFWEKNTKKPLLYLDLQFSGQFFI